MTFKTGHIDAKVRGAEIVIKLRWDTADQEMSERIGKGLAAIMEIVLDPNELKAFLADFKAELEAQRAKAKRAKRAAPRHAAPKAGAK